MSMRALRALVLVGACALFVLSGAPTNDARAEAPTRRYESRPDLKPPTVEILKRTKRTSPGYIFIAPKKEVVQAGPLILDNRGRVVWFLPLNTHGVTDFRMQRYRGRPVLTWWHGQPDKGSGERAAIPSTTTPTGPSHACKREMECPLTSTSSRSHRGTRP